MCLCVPTSLYAPVCAPAALRYACASARCMVLIGLANMQFSDLSPAACHCSVIIHTMTVTLPHLGNGFLDQLHTLKAHFLLLKYHISEVGRSAMIGSASAADPMIRLNSQKQWHSQNLTQLAFWGETYSRN